MDQLFQDLDFVYVYLDDILIASDSHTKHEKHVNTVMQQLEQAGLVPNVSKCQYAADEITFLGS